MLCWQNCRAGLILLLSLLLYYPTSTAAVPFRRHLLQVAEPYQTTQAADDEPVTTTPTTATSNQAAADPYSHLLELTIQHQLQNAKEESLVVDQMLNSQPPTDDDQTSRGRHVSVDASRDGSREEDLDNMTARSPSLKSLEENRDEDDLNLLMFANVVDGEFTDEAPRPTAPSLLGVGTTGVSSDPNGDGVAVENSEPMTTPASHPNYQMSMHGAGPQPWQSPMLDGGLAESYPDGAKPELTSLVESQMNSYFPRTSEVSSISASSSSSQHKAVLGQVQQSLAKALRQDLTSLYSVFLGKEDTVHDQVQDLYKDYSLKDSAPLAKGNAPLSNEDNFHNTDMDLDHKVMPMETTPASEQITTKKPLDLKNFFAKYDFEVDADMMQDKILNIFQQSAEMDDSKVDSEVQEAESVIAPLEPERKKSPVDHMTHFHHSENFPSAELTTDQHKACDKPHDLLSIFKNFDFEVDADKVEERIDQYHKQLVEKKDKDTNEKPAHNSLSNEETVDLKKLLTSFDLEIDAEEIEKQLTDFHAKAVGINTLQPPTNLYGPYFTEEEKHQYDEETMEDFYTQFFSMKGMVIGI